MAFNLECNKSIKGDIIFLDENGTKIESGNNIFAQSWNLSGTGSFEKNGLKIKNGISNINTLTSITSTKNILKSVDELDFICNIGSGAVGTVKKALHKPTSTYLAIKCMDFFDKNTRKQLYDEIHTYLNFDHPYIVKFCGCCINHSTEQLFLALQYCVNGSLHSYILKNGRFTEEECKKISIQIISALSYLEFNRVIHRDIKPQNILLDVDMNALLADFGIKKDLLQTAARTQIGTMLYMSPERMNGVDYSYESDIWSFGLTILFCIYGRFPYETNKDKKMSLLDFHIAVVEDEPPKLPTTDLNGKPFSMEFISFIQACLYKNAKKRWKASDLLMHPFLTGQ